MRDIKDNAIDLVELLSIDNPIEALQELRDTVDCLSVNELVDLYNAFGAIASYLESRLHQTAITGEYQQNRLTLH